MADSLLSFQEALDQLPDNVVRDIAPIDVREAYLSLLPDRGGVFLPEGAYTIPIATAGTWVDINQAVAGSIVLPPSSLFWRKDGNGRAVYDYAADWPNVEVPPGLSRAVTIISVATIDPNGDRFEFASGVSGVPVSPFYDVDTAAATNAVTVAVITRTTLDVSLAPPVSLMVRNTDNANDLDLVAFGTSIIGGPLA